MGGVGGWCRYSQSTLCEILRKLIKVLPLKMKEKET